MSDEMGRRCVAELVKEIPERIYPVGRLSRDSGRVTAYDQ